jgi:hypothetical protein
MMVDARSTWRGLRTWRPRRQPVRYALRRQPMGGLWLHCWTPTWHDGRGPYVSIGLGPWALYRGY